STDAASAAPAPAPAQAKAQATSTRARRCLPTGPMVTPKVRRTNSARCGSAARRFRPLHLESLEPERGEVERRIPARGQVRDRLAKGARELEAVARAGARQHASRVAGQAIEHEVPVGGVRIEADARRAAPPAPRGEPPPQGLSDRGD